ncbi:hypothetical protein PAXRUDRAFT_35874 [Paxillus rubicundulus Ve08.2h10]|uniref:Uncharacterized protein n=1 Tax=Paxillus rubicundulus Ve08.2h10 TaxID=930991 RepID=A0A0D0CFJ2_9AGAM|nr:hypothetical protein PAXRUDRAFT_35874 [Paxillus rubicundulus Ve08.2h10]
MLRANVEVENYTVKDAESGLKYLESKLLCIVGEPINSEHLMTTLFNISQLKNISRPAIEAIRAITYLIGEQEASKVAITISEQVKEIISGEVTSQVVIAISPHMANLLQMAEQMETNTKELEKLIDKTNEQATSSQSCTQNANSPSYSDAERQILLEAIEGNSLYKPGKTAASIAKEVQKILTTIKQDDCPDLNIKAITKLKSGGLILELNSMSLAKWLRKEGNCKHFLNALETPVEMKYHTYTVIVPFIPISTPIEDTNWRRALEMENNLTENSVILTKWIKPKHK